MQTPEIFSGEARDSSLIVTQSQAALLAVANIAKFAGRAADKPAPDARMVFASTAKQDIAAAVAHLTKVNEQERQQARHNREEPFLLRLELEAADGDRLAFLLSRGGSLGPITSEASDQTFHTHLDTPIALRAQQAEIDDTLSFRGKEFRLISRTEILPRRQGGVWDSHRNHLLHSKFLVAGGYHPLSLAQEVLLETQPRAELDGMSLRDQAFGSSEQIEIYAAPLSGPQLVVGPAGSGKTTTMMMRLRAKATFEALPDDEKELVTKGTPGEGSLEERHAESWVLFTPTKLLARYLEDTFAKNNIHNPKYQMKVWDEFQNELGKEVLGILRRKTVFMEPGLVNLSDAALRDFPRLFTLFRDFHEARLLERLRGHWVELQKLAGKGTELDQVLQQLALTLKQDTSLRGIHQALMRHLPELKQQATSIQHQLRQMVTQFENYLTNRVRVTGAGSLPAGLASASRASLLAAVTELATDQPASKESLTHELAQLIAAVPKLPKPATLGLPLQRLQRLEALCGLMGEHFKLLPESLAAFRKADPEWFVPTEDTGKIIRLDSHELDLLIAVALDEASDLLRRDGQEAAASTGWGHLAEAISSVQRNLIFVDEAMDFTPLQLRAMLRLSRPEIGAFFAAGDFNQRLTACGTASEADFRWAVPGIRIHSLKKGWRQSAELSEFATRLLALSKHPQSEKEPQEIARGQSGLPPLFSLQNGSFESQMVWIAEQISTLFAAEKTGPSTAVFVPLEEDLVRAEALLSAALMADNIKVKARPDGQAFDTGVKVQIFAARHIKGLEFEAAFLAGLDQFEKTTPGMLEKYLYVSATRASDSLGLTSSEPLSGALGELLSSLPAGWELQDRTNA